MENDRAFYSYRGKGGKTGRRELPRPAFEAILRSLADIEKQVEVMAPDESLWQAGAGERGVTSATFYNRLRKYQRTAGLQGSGVHIFRHTAAKLRPTSPPWPSRPPSGHGLLSHPSGHDIATGS